MIINDPLLIPNILIFIFVLALLTVAIVNLRSLHNLHSYTQLSNHPRISVLVPARNEENTISACLNSLLAQNYPDFQVIVLDDNSIDGTGEILKSIAAKDQRLQIIKGKNLPEGWLGKHWACHQLYLEADGEILVFTDSDTVHTPDTLLCTAASMTSEKADMFSIVPGHRLGTLAEKLAIPFFALAVFAVVPLPARLKPKNVTLISSSGKLIAFRRHAYEAIGGFQAIRQNVLDDLVLAQKVISHGMRFRLFNGTDNVTCRMYYSFKEVHEGLTKNTFAAYGYNVPLFVITWLWIGFAFCEPIIVLATLNLSADMIHFSSFLAAASILISLMVWLLYYIRFKFPVYMVIFYPISALFMVIIALSSMIRTLSGKATWKDRKMPTRKSY